ELDRALREKNFSARNFAAFSKRQRRRYETYRRFVVGFYSPQVCGLFFHSRPPKAIFPAGGARLAGGGGARFLRPVFHLRLFLLVALQRRFAFARTRFRRDAATGYP